jgi:hypothetical protein
LISNITLPSLVVGSLLALLMTGCSAGSEPTSARPSDATAPRQLSTASAPQLKLGDFCALRGTEIRTALTTAAELVSKFSETEIIDGSEVDQELFFNSADELHKLEQQAPTPYKLGFQQVRASLVEILEFAREPVDKTFTFDEIKTGIEGLETLDADCDEVDARAAADAQKLAELPVPGNQWMFLCDSTTYETLQAAWIAQDAESRECTARLAAEGDPAQVAVDFGDILAVCATVQRSRDDAPLTTAPYPDKGLYAAASAICPNAPHAPRLKAVGRGEIFADGNYVVGQDIPAGTYRSEKRVRDCYWERTTPNGDIIDNNLATFASAGALVTVRDGESFNPGEECGEWRKE